MIVVDTTILSSLAKIKYLHLIKEIFSQEQIIICNAVMKELFVSKEKGYEFVENILKHTAYKTDELNNTRWLLFRNPDERVSKEINNIYEKYPLIHFGELEGIAFAKVYGSGLLIDDRRAYAVAQAENIEAYSLPALIHYARFVKIINIEEVRQIIHLLEIKDHYKLKQDVKQKLLG